MAEAEQKNNEGYAAGKAKTMTALELARQQYPRWDDETRLATIAADIETLLNITDWRTISDGLGLSANWLAKQGYLEMRMVTVGKGIMAHSYREYRVSEKGRAL